MRVGIDGFQPKRLTQARELRQLTKKILSELISTASSNISRWENGTQLPEYKSLEALSKILNVPVSFFMRPLSDHGDKPFFFRSMASATKSLRKRTEFKLCWAQEISAVLQELLDFPLMNIPRLDITDFWKITDIDIENIASECRKRWNLGNSPLADVLLIMENAGIIVVKEEVGAVAMDGLSHWSSLDNRPYVLIAKDKKTCVRSRMDAAHELGHLVLHHAIDKSALNKRADFKEIERQAFYFAGAFLMPAETFSAEIYTPSLDSFLALKERWKVSIGAMIVRCTNLDMISKEYKLKLWKYYSSRGWRKGEPMDDKLISEEPRLLARSIKLLVEENIRSCEQLLNDFRINGEDIERLTNLPRGYMSKQKADIINLPKLKTSISRTSSVKKDAVIIDFKKK